MKIFTIFTFNMPERLLFINEIVISSNNERGNQNKIALVYFEENSG